MRYERNKMLLHYKQIFTINEIVKRNMEFYISIAHILNECGYVLYNVNSVHLYIYYMNLPLINK